MPLSVEERDELRTTARALLERESSSDRVRAAVDEPPGFDGELWKTMVELGWTSVHLDERVGGAGCGFADLSLLLHELGRAITPSPFLASVLTSSALMLADNEDVAVDLLSAFTSEGCLGSVAFAGEDGSYDHMRLTTSWRSEGESLRLDGASGYVLDADLAEVLVVAARDRDDVIATVAVDPRATGVRVERVPTVDQTRRLFSVYFDGVVVGQDRMLCDPGPKAGELLDHVLAVGVIAAACDATGAAEKTLENAAGYATERMQFGKPIGSFQAVKHHCADMAIAVKASRAATAAAAEALDGDRGAWVTTAAITSSYVGPACAEVCALGLLVHGGIGFTWEHDSHLYLKRVKLDELLFGTPSSHRRRLADAVFPTLAAS